jgi:hypothetical protein
MGNVQNTTVVSVEHILFVRGGKASEPCSIQAKPLLMKSHMGLSCTRRGNSEAVSARVTSQRQKPHPRIHKTRSFVQIGSLFNFYYFY